MILPISTAKGSYLYKKLTVVLGYSITRTRFYRFLACKCMSWDKLWHYVFKLIPAPLEKGRLILAFDDSINPKSGKKVFDCEKFFDHAAKHNQSHYPWAQTFIKIGLLKWHILVGLCCHCWQDFIIQLKWPVLRNLKPKLSKLER